MSQSTPRKCRSPISQPLTRRPARLLLFLSPLLFLTVALADPIPPRLASLPPATTLSNSSRSWLDLASEVLSRVIGRVHPDHIDGLTLDNDNEPWRRSSPNNLRAQQLPAPPPPSHEPPILADTPAGAAPDPRYGYNVVRIARRAPQGGGSAVQTTTAPPANSPSPSPAQVTSPVPSPTRTTSRAAVTSAERSPSPSPSPDGGDEDPSATTHRTFGGRTTATGTAVATSTSTSTSTAEEANTPATSTGVSTGTIIAIVIAGLAAVTIAGMAIWVFQKFTLRPSQEHKSRLETTYSPPAQNPKSVLAESRPVSGASFASGSNQFRAPTPVIGVAALPTAATSAPQYPPYGYVVEAHAPATYAMAGAPAFAYAAAPTTVQPQLTSDGYYVYYDDSDGGPAVPASRMR